MPKPKQRVSMKYGTQAEYDALITKDTNTIYFITDKSRVYVGTTEYTHHIALFDSMPEGQVCLPESLFIVRATQSSVKVYYSADGYADSAILISEISAIGDPGTFGPNQDANLDFGQAFNVPYFTVNEQGKITEAGSSQLTLPSVPNLSKQTSGSGNAITEMNVNGHIISISKGKTFAEKSQLDALDNTVTNIQSQISGKVNSVSASEGDQNGKFILTVNGVSTAISIHGLGSAAFSESRNFATLAQGVRADNAISKYGGTMEGPLEVEEPTLSSHAATKQYVDDNAYDNSLSSVLKWGCETQGIVDPDGITLPNIEDTSIVNELTYIFTPESSTYTFTAPSGYILGDDTGFGGLTAGNSIQYSDLTVGNIYQFKFKVIDGTHIALIKKEWDTSTGLHDIEHPVGE